MIPIQGAAALSAATQFILLAEAAPKASVTPADNTRFGSNNLASAKIIFLRLKFLHSQGRSQGPREGNPSLVRRMISLAKCLNTPAWPWKISQLPWQKREKPELKCYPAQLAPRLLIGY